MINKQQFILPSLIPKFAGYLAKSWHVIRSHHCRSLRVMGKKIVGNNRIMNMVYQRFNGCYIIQDIIGNNNQILVGKGTKCKNSIARIRGNNCKLIIGRGCYFGPNCSFWLSGDNVEISIGDYCSFTTTCHINASEDNSKIVICNDCMFSNHVIIRTSDDHPIYDYNSNIRLNPAKNVLIEDHVWIAPNTKVFKGSIIRSGSIIGSDTTINREVAENCMAVGRPFKIVKTNIKWTRESLF